MRPIPLRWPAEVRPAKLLMCQALAALVVALAGVLLGSGAVAADTTTLQTASTTYTLVPAMGVIQVVIDLRVENHAASTTGHLVNSAVEWVESEATGLVVTADRGAVTRSILETEPGFILWKLGFEPVVGGQVRMVHISYAIAGGKPRSTSSTRVGAAYAEFCAYGNGFDGGSVSVVIPAAFATTTTGGTATRSTSGGKTTYRSGVLADAANYYLCIEGTNDAAYRQTSLVPASGRAIIIESWPEDREWLDAVRAVAGRTEEALQRLMGRDFSPVGMLTIREVGLSHLGDYAGTFDPTALVAEVGESLDAGTIAHELSHAWFNDSLYADRWLDEGSASWAESVVTPGSRPCPYPGSYPGTGLPNLNNWLFLDPKSTEAERAEVGYLYEASCYVVSQAATAIGPDRALEVLAYLMDRRVPYLAAEPDRLPAGSVSWQTWLDVTDEVGMVPAGADLDELQRLLATFGVASNAKELALRSQARAAYHDFETLQPSWQVPVFIRRALANWDFPDAVAALETGRQLRSVAAQIDATLPEAGSLGGTAKTAFEQAPSLADLKAALANAQALERAADAVVAARTASLQGPGVVEWIGLMGIDLGELRQAAVSAIFAGEPVTAESRAAALTGVIEQARLVGSVRLAGLVLGAGAILLLRHRRRVAHTTAGASRGEPPATDGWRPYDLRPSSRPPDQLPDQGQWGVGAPAQTWGAGVNDVGSAAADPLEISLRRLEWLHGEGLLTDEEFATELSEIYGRI